MKGSWIWIGVCFGLLSGVALLINVQARSFQQPEIAFASERDGNLGIYVMDADGKNIRRLTDDSSADLGPAWSPDGRRIAFCSWRDGNGEMYVMDADGKNVRNLTKHPMSDWEPAWSPDGQSIAFVSNRDEKKIYVMDADGKNVHRLAEEWLGRHFSPAWSPDGRKIVFVSKRDNDDWEIYVIDANGSNLRRLTNSSGLDSSPAWNPSAVYSVSPIRKAASKWGWVKWISK